MALFLCAPQALYAVNKHVDFTAYRTTFELPECRVSDEPGRAGSEGRATYLPVLFTDRVRGPSKRRRRRSSLSEASLEDAYFRLLKGTGKNLVVAPKKPSGAFGTED